MAAPHKHQLNLPPTPLQSLSQDADSRKKVSQADIDAAQLLDAALEAAGISSKEVSILAGVSESLVSRWRSGNYTEAPSFAQMLLMPPSFHIALHRQMNRKFGFGRAALARLLGAVEDLAMCVEA